MLSFGIKHAHRFGKLRKAGKGLFNYDLSSESGTKHSYRLQKLSKLPFFFAPLFRTFMDKSLGTLLPFWGVFQCRQVQPLPSPHKQCWTRVSRTFFRVTTFYRVGGGRTARKFRKRCTVLRGNREITEKYEYFSTVQRTFVQEYSNEIRAGAGKEKQYGRITFPLKKKRI